VSQSITHSRRRVFTLIVAAAALCICVLSAERAEASSTRRGAGATRRATIALRRCERLSRERRACVRSARLHHAKHRRRTASRKNSLQQGLAASEARAAQAPTPATAPGAQGEACANTELVPSSTNIAQVREATLCLINEQRLQHGELALVESSKLDSAALAHSEDMVARDYFEHTTPSGEEFEARIIASGYIPRGAAYELGENIDTATLSLSTAAATVTAWMNSAEHRDNILNGEFRETGVGVAPAAPAYFAGGQSGATYTQDFGVLAS
jgi:uncharacterized protein YkwD